MKDYKLRSQLKADGATPKELEALAALAKTLPTVAPRGLSPEAKRQIAEEIGITRVARVPKLVLSGVGGFAAIVVVVMSQSSLPGSPLYPVKRSSEKVREVVQPSYTNDVVEKRKEEIEELKTKSADEDRIHKAEDAYRDAVKRQEKTRRRHNKSGRQQNYWHKDKFQRNKRHDTKQQYNQDKGEDRSRSQYGW